MSLSSFLLKTSTGSTKPEKKKGKIVLDNDLDAIFRASDSLPPPVKKPPTALALEADTHQTEDAGPSSTPQLKRKRKTDKTTPEAPQPSVETAKERKREKKRKVERPVLSSDSEDDAQLEDAYAATRIPSQGAQPSDVEHIQSSSGDENEGQASTGLVHESVLKGSKKKDRGARSRKTKVVPEGETKEQRDGRTVFVGNVPAEVVKSRPLQKRLKQHILSFVPSAKAESIRLRAVPFQKPTAPLPTSDDESKKGKGKAEEKKPERQGREHDIARAATWRQTKDADGVEDEATAKKYLKPSEKKKVAFIKGELNPNADALVAYIVFAHPTQPPSVDPTLPPTKAAMDPYEAAREAARLADGSVFMEHTLRVDCAAPTDADDPKATLFVGNLDFAAKEEDLRVFFEGLVAAERGPPPDGQKWVARVRVVRDRDTQLGKGFAYVRFTERECVDEVLALEAEQVKFAKRKLRVQRCKAGGQSKPHTKPKDTSAKPPFVNTKAKDSPRVVRAPVVVPKGDPSLGDRLAALPKEARKEAKAADEARVQRRLAKKKARSALEKAAAPKGKERERVRKRVGAKKAAKEGKKGSRIRSEKSLEKRNAKK